MRNNRFNVAAIAAGLIILSSFFIIAIHAQSGASNSSPSSVTTNWMGCLVIGQDDTVDQISPGPHPKTMQHVQIGLRSDGVVVWRNSPNLK